MTLATLMLDQGLTASLVSQKSITTKMAGAASSVNLILALTMFAATWLFAAPIASFFNTPELKLVMPVLGVSLLFKALMIVPMMMLTRQQRFPSIAAAEVFSALVGGVAGLVAAFTSWDYWAIVVQLVVTDLVAAAIFIVRARPPFPNFAFYALKGSIGFGIRVFFGNLVSFASRNVDNLLVGKFAGATQLGFYALAYRVLLTPVQMIGQTVTRVLFPAIARVREDRPEVSRLMVKSTRSIALAAFPIMALVAISAPDTILLFLGDAWAPAVPVLMILSITGARQAVTSTNAPLLLGTGRADIHLRFNLVASAVQIGGIVAGLPFGIVGVAWGYTIAGLLLTPTISYLQKLLAGTTYRKQLGTIVAPFICSLSAVAAYYLVSLAPLPLIARLMVGSTLFVLVFAGTLRLFFVRTWREAQADVLTMLPGR
jgi:polysaccharide transporter, PST family